MAKALKDLPLKELCIKLHILRYIWLYKVCNFMHKFQAILVLEFEDLTSTSWCSNWIQEWIEEHFIRINLGTRFIWIHLELWLTIYSLLQIPKYCILVSFYYKICFQSTCTIFIYQRMLNIPWGRILDTLHFYFIFQRRLEYF